MKAELNTVDGCVREVEVADDYVRHGARLVTPLFTNFWYAPSGDLDAKILTREYRFVGYANHPIKGRTAIFKEDV